MMSDQVNSIGRSACAVFIIAASMLIATAQPRAAEDANAQKEVAGATVSVVPTERTSFTETVLVTGSLIARQEVLVSPQIEGYRISEILADEGDRVEAGQVLAKLADAS